MPTLTPAERHARREARRRRIRRRRIAALAFFALALAGLGAGLAIKSASAGRGEARDGTTTTSTIETTATGSTSTETTTTTPKPGMAKPRGRLGSGRPVTLAFGGDVHFEGIVRSRLDANPSLPFAPIAPVLRRADLAMVNLETTVSLRGSPTPGKEYTFRAPPTAFAALKIGRSGRGHGRQQPRHRLRDGLLARHPALRQALPLPDRRRRSRRRSGLRALPGHDQGPADRDPRRLAGDRRQPDLALDAPARTSPGSPRHSTSAASPPRFGLRARRQTPSSSISTSARSGTAAPTACRRASLAA